MAKSSKKQKVIKTLVREDKVYPLKEAIGILKEAPKAKFDESVDISMDLSIDAKKLTQPIRGMVRLPHGTGKRIKVLCLCKGENDKKARQAGADYVGAAELVAKIKDGWLDFDVIVATPDMMRDIGKLGKLLGPKGLMPSPKSGTVTTDVTKTITDIKAGKIEYKMDKQGGIHTSVGKLSFDMDKLHENVRSLISAIISSNTDVSKPQAISTIFIAKTMGPAIRLDLAEFGA